MPQKQLDEDQLSEKTCNKPLKSLLKVRLVNGEYKRNSELLFQPKYRVRFNEALNTFFECDYVIYVDGDDEDNENLEADDEDLQALPQESMGNVIEEELDDQITLSPPEEYKDGLEDFALDSQGVVAISLEDSSSPSGELGLVDETGAGSGGDLQGAASPSASHSDQPVIDNPPEAKPLNGILKGGKLWRASSAEKSGVRFFAAETPSSRHQQSDIYSTRASNSAFQQLFPRARKLLQELPEKDIDYLSNNRYVRNSIPAAATTADQATRSEKRSPVSEEPNYVSQNLLRYSLAWNHPLLRESESQQSSQQKLQEPPATASLVEKLRWLTTDVAEPQFPAEAAQESHKPPEEKESGATSQTRTNFSDTPSAKTSESPEDKESSDVATPTTVSKNSKPSEKSSKYRKLNDLFSRSRNKDKQKSGKNSEVSKSDSNKKSRTRSFSPPPPSELEPKMKVKEKRHIIHIISKKKEFLGKLPNVVPAADHQISRGLDLVKDSQASTEGSANLRTEDEALNGETLDPDDLSAFAQQDQNRTERIRKRYSNNNADSDDETEDYGFLRRPSVRGIKTRASSSVTVTKENVSLTPLQRLPGNIYGSTGNLYQHVSAQQRPTVTDQRSALERTASASFTTESSVYATLSRQRPHLMVTQQRFERPTEITIPETFHGNPQRYALPVAAANAVLVPNASPHRLPCSLPCYVTPKSAYVTPPEAATGVRYLGYPRSVLQVKSPCYRQVLPSLPVLRPEIQEEREGPEGSSSSPSLQSDVAM